MGDVEDVIGDCGLYVAGVRRSDRLPLCGAARAAQDAGGFAWVGVQEPTEAQLAAVAAEFSLPALAVEDALRAHQRPKAELHGDVLFVVLKPVRYVDHDEVVDVAEIALFVGRNFVVSVRHGHSTVLRRVRSELDAARGRGLLRGPTAMLHRTIDLAVDEYGEVVTAIDVDIAEIEAQVFGTGESDHSERIYKLKREVLEFRRAVAPLREPLQRLAEKESDVVDAAAAPYFRDVHDHLLRTIDGIDRHDGLLSDILQANVARVSVRHSEIAVRQNEDMRRISAWAAIALVPTAIAGIYGMNFEYMPETKWRYGYFAVLAVIAVACTGLHRLFRRNGWL